MAPGRVLGRSQTVLFCRIPYLQFLVTKILDDGFIKCLVLSAYVRGNEAVINEPYIVYQRFKRYFSSPPLVPDLPGCGLLDFRRNQHHILGAYRHNLYQCLQYGRGTPTQLTLLLAALYQALKVPCRLCSAWTDEVSGELSTAQKSAIHRCILGKSPESRSSRFPQIVPPVIWIEVFWQQVNQWVGVEQFSGFFNFQISLNPQNQTPLSLNESQLRPKYLNKYQHKIVPKLKLSYLNINNITRINRPTDNNTIMAGLFLGNLNDEEDDDLSEIDSIFEKSSSVVDPLLVDTDVLGQRVPEIEDECLRLSLIDRNYILRAEPFSHFARSSPQLISFCWFLKKVKSVIAVNCAMGLMDVTIRYLPISLLLKKHESMEYLTKLYPSPDHEFAHLDRLDEISLVKLKIELGKESFPDTLKEFRKHPVYCLESLLKKNEVFVRPEIGSVPLGYFKGEPVWLRRQQIRVALSRTQWIRQGRKIREGEQPIKYGSKLLTPLYIENQTDLIESADLEDGPGYYIAGGVIPPGWIHVRESNWPGVTRACRSLNIDFKYALVGYDFMTKKAVKDGIVIRSEDYESVMTRQVTVEVEIKNALHKENMDRAVNCWTVLMKVILAHANSG